MNLEKTVELARQHLDPGEQVVHSVIGTYATEIMGKPTQRAGALIATDRRLVFFSKRMTGYDFESFPYENISSFEAGKRMLGANVTFYASGNRVSIKNARPEGLNPLVEYARSRMGKPGAPATTDLADQIRKLAQLRDDGILTDAEFDAKKADLLS